MTNINKRTIFINSQLVNDTIGLKKTLYHEIGHWFGLSDTDNEGIMKRSYNLEQDAAISIEYWDKMVDGYFTELKRHERNN